MFFRRGFTHLSSKFEEDCQRVGFVLFHIQESSSPPAVVCQSDDGTHVKSNDYKFPSSFPEAPGSESEGWNHHRS